MKLSIYSIVLCCAVNCLPSWAVPITDTVLVGGREWAQPADFKAFSWNTVNQQCPGLVCAVGSSLNNYQLEGWTWASVDDVQSLFNAYIGLNLVAPTTIAVPDSTWATAFFLDFRSTDHFAEVVNGVSKSQHPSPNDVYAPFIANDRLVATNPTFDIANTRNAIRQTSAPGNYGVWFFRPVATVPSPTTLTLICLGVAVLGATCRKRIAYS